MKKVIVGICVIMCVGCNHTQKRKLHEVKKPVVKETETEKAKNITIEFHLFENMNMTVKAI